MQYSHQFDAFVEQAGANISWRDTMHQSRTTSRRHFLGASAALGGGLLATRGATAAPRPVMTAFEAARQQATPEAEIRPSLHTYPLVKEKTTFRVLVPTYGIDWVNNDFTKWYEDLTNVHIEFTTVPDEGAMTQLNLMMASGDYPDIIMGFNWAPFELTMTAISAYGAAGQVIALNDYLADNAPNLQQLVMPEYPIAERLITLPGGQILSMPYINDCYHCGFTPSKLWVHTDWLEALQLERPETLDDMTAMLQAIMDGDPNGNGQADEIPLTASINWNPWSYFLGSFGPSPKKPWLYNDGGTITAAYTQEGWRESATYLNGLASQQLLAVDAFTQNDEQFRQIGDQRRIGVGPGVVADVFFTNSEQTEDLKRSYRMLAPLEGPGGLRSSYRDYDESHLGNVFVVTDRCADPALAVAWADGLYAWEATTRSIQGVPGRDWKLADEGMIGIDGEPARVQQIPVETEPGAPNTRSWAQLSPSFRNAKDRLSWAVIGDRELDTEVILYEGCAEFLEPYANAPEVDLIRPVFDPDTAVRVAELEVALTAYVDEHFAQSVTGQIDPQAGWEEFQSQLQMLGVEEYLALQQEAFDAQNG
jgi:putative aldouronate transport system substrate-binding protein